MYVLHRAGHGLDDTVGDIHQIGHVLGQEHVFILGAAITKVIAHIHVSRHHIADTAEDGKNLVLIARKLIVIILPHEHFLALVPLIRNPIVRQGLGDPAELFGQMGGITLNKRLIDRGSHKIVSNGQRRCHAELVFDPGGNGTIGLQPVEDREIANGVIGVTGLECHRRRVDTINEFQPVNFIDDLAVILGKLKRRDGFVVLERRVGFKPVINKADPALTPPGFTIRNSLHMLADAATQCAKNRFSVIKRYAAHHVNNRMVVIANHYCSFLKSRPATATNYAPPERFRQMPITAHAKPNLIFSMAIWKTP